MLVKNQYYESTISIELMALQKYSRFKPLPFPKRYHPKERHAPFHGSKGNKLHEAESQKKKKQSMKKVNFILQAYKLKMPKVCALISQTRAKATKAK